MTLDIATVGVWLLIVSAVAIVIEGVLATVWSLRVVRRSVALRTHLESAQAQLRADVERLLAAVAESQVLWQPYARLLRWTRHPVSIALIQSYARRRRAVR